MIQQHGLDIKNVCVFLLAINGIFSISPDYMRGDHHLQSSDRELKFTEAEGRRVQSYFDLLYRNRLVSQNSKPVEESNKVSDNPTHFVSPRHEQHTRQLASKYRSKMV